MNERFWTTKDPDYWHHGGEQGRYGRNDDGRGRTDRYDDYSGRYGEHDPSFYYGGFRDKRHMGRIYAYGQGSGDQGYGHSGRVYAPAMDYDWQSDRNRNEGRMSRAEGNYREPRFYEDERFGESHQHRHHARTSDMWDRPAAYNRGGYGAADFGGERYEAGERWADRGNRDFDRGYYDDRGYRGQGYEDIHRWRGW